MRKYRKLLISALLVAGTAATAWFLYRGRQSPPAAVRLLPEGDLLVYADFRPVHLLDLKFNPVQLEGDYQQFVEQTGIQFERDLDEVAMSRHDASGGNDVESAEIFVGRFDSARLERYLQKNSTQVENYRDRTIYAIPNAGHTVRACILDGSKIAVTNMASAETMHGIIDRFHRASAGPSLLGAYYRHVPAGSLAWMIDRIPAHSDAPQLPGDLNFSFLQNTVALLSLRYNGALLFRADVFAQSETAARSVVNSANTFLLMYQSVSNSLGAKGNDPDVKAALNSIRVEQKGNAAIFTATFSRNFLKKIASDVQPQGLPGSPSGTPVPRATPAPTVSPFPQRRRKQQSPPFATCSATPAEVFAGEPVSASAVARNFDPKHDLTYEWATNGGKVEGQGEKVTVVTTGVAEGQSYSIYVHIRDTRNEKAVANCMAGFQTKKR